MTDPISSDAQLAAAIGGTWSVDISTWCVEWSKEASAIHESPRRFTPTVWEALDFIDLADRPQLFAFAAACVQGRAPFEMEVGLTTARGRNKRVRVSGFPPAPATGHTRRMRGTISQLPGLPAIPAGPDAGRVQLLGTLRQWEAFARAIPHELASPLMSIRGFAKILSELGEPLSERGTRYLGRINAAAAQASSLLDGLRTLVPLSSRELRRDVVDLSQIAHECIEALRSQQPHRRVDADVARNVVTHGDADVLRLVMANLLGNAWKFTAQNAHARITFDAEEREGGKVFRVADNGVGFNMAEAPRLFTPFQRLHAPQHFDGSGVGLAVVRRAVELHGGSVWAHSAPDSGASFLFALPASEAVR